MNKRTDGAFTMPQRNNFFFGKMMGVAQFEQEQTYGIEMRRMLNRLSLGCGVVCGLKVRAGDRDLSILPGVAIDPLGREIVLDTTRIIDPSALTDLSGKLTGEHPQSDIVHIGLVYAEQAIDEAPVLIPDCDTPAGSACDTIEERACLVVLEGTPGVSASVTANDICGSMFGSAVERTTGRYAVSRTIDTRGAPLAAVITQDGQRALVAAEDSSGRILLQVLDLSGSSPDPIIHRYHPRYVQPPFGGLSIAPKGGLVYISHAGGITAIDLEGDLSTQPETMPEPTPYGVCAAVIVQESILLFAFNLRTRSVDVIEPLDSHGRWIWNVKGTIEVGCDIDDIAVSPDNDYIYALSKSTGVIIRIVGHLSMVEARYEIEAGVRTLAVRVAGIDRIAYIAAKDRLQAVGLSGPGIGIPLRVTPIDSCFADGGARYCLLHRMGEGENDQLIVFDAEKLTEITRLSVGRLSSSLAATGTQQRLLVTNAGSSTVSIIDKVDHLTSDQRRAVLCEQIGQREPPIPGPLYVPLALVKLRRDGTIGVVDSCACRASLYSNAVLYEMILCLAQRIDECCLAQTPSVVGQTGPFTVNRVVFLADDQQQAEFTQPEEPPLMKESQNITTLGVEFNRSVNSATVVTFTGEDASDPRIATFLVAQTVEGQIRPIAGEIREDPSLPNMVTFVIRDERFWPGVYRVTLFGDPEPGGRRQAITDSGGVRLDGDSNGSQGGNFSFEFTVEDDIL